MITSLNKNCTAHHPKILFKYQALDSMSSSISRTAWSGTLPDTKPLSERLFKGPFPNRHTCGSIWFNRFHSSSDRDQLKMSMFFLILSGFRLHGSTLVPLCSPQRKITWNRVSMPNTLLKPWAVPLFLVLVEDRIIWKCNWVWFLRSYAQLCSFLFWQNPVVVLIFHYNTVTPWVLFKASEGQRRMKRK